MTTQHRVLPGAGQNRLLRGAKADVKTRAKARIKTVATIGVAWGLAAGLSLASMLAVAAPHADSSAQSSAQSTTAHPLDRSGQKQIGKASFYASRYAGKTMADGTPMRLYGDNAASLTLPLGSTARVTNLETGRSAMVTIRDRGPYIKGRIIDLSPLTARRIGLTRRQGLANVEVTPVRIPLADGTVKVFSSGV